MKRIAVLGSTGSVGRNALRIAAQHPDRFEVCLLAAGSSKTKLREQCQRFSPDAAVLVHGSQPDQSLGGGRDYRGESGLIDALEQAQPDLLLNAITGAAGLPTSEWAVANGRTLALANKESLVMAGPYLMQRARETGATILPVDSEHCAIFQCLHGEDPARLRYIHLTASGGPFRTTPAEQFADLTVDQALAHPTWDMGPRITIGSATLMNKAFEVVEARWLFDLAPQQIKIAVHPQSIVHSMVEFVDGSMLAQLGIPDMRVPILYCLGWPDRLKFDFEPFDFANFANLTFEPVDRQRFPAIDLAFQVLERGGDSGAVLNAADEVMTGLFLDGKVPFPAITATVAEVLRRHEPSSIQSIDQVMAADSAARELARQLATTAS